MGGLFVVADDRTGALEVAGECAVAIRAPVAVGVGSHPAAADRSSVWVVDAGTRHLPSEQAARRSAAVAATAGADDALAHKIDSTLRGNWAAELVARQRTTASCVLIVPAFPAVGRRCVGGVVTAHGVPVADAAIDARGTARSSRPADLVRAAGAESVIEVAPGGRLESWLSETARPGSAGFAVCDAADDDDLRAIGSAWERHVARVTFAGTAGSIGVAAGCWAARAQHAAPEQGRRDGSPAAGTPVRLPALVVCGSLHDVARAQVASLVQHGASERVVAGDGEQAVPLGRHAQVLVLRSVVPDAPVVADMDAQATARRLGAAAQAEMQTGRWQTVVAIGGDTAAALLGDEAVVVGGTVAPGMPWLRRAEADGPVVVTKAGGFGDSETLVQLLLERTIG